MLYDCTFNDAVLVLTVVDMKYCGKLKILVRYISWSTNAQNDRSDEILFVY